MGGHVCSAVAPTVALFSGDRHAHTWHRGVFSDSWTAFALSLDSAVQVGKRRLVTSRGRCCDDIPGLGESEGEKQTLDKGMIED